MNLRTMAKKLSQKLLRQDKQNSRKIRKQTDATRGRFKQWWDAFVKDKDEYTAADDNRPASRDSKAQLDNEAKQHGVKTMPAKTNGDMVDYASAVYAAGLGNSLTDFIGGKLREVFTSPKHKRQAKAIINEALDSANWSDRIWANAGGLRADLYKMMRRSLLTKTDPRQFNEQLEKTFGVAHHEADRLLRTEGARVHTRKQLLDFKDDDHAQAEWVTQDGACDKCKAMDGKVFDVSDDPEKMPPYHPNCRCVLMPHDE